MGTRTLHEQSPSFLRLELAKTAFCIPDAAPAAVHELTGSFHGYVDHDRIHTLKEGVAVP
jgi:hypothetical protein